MKELRVTLRVRNNLLLERREAEEKSPMELAHAAGVSYGAYLRLEGMKKSPFRANGEFRSIAVRIAEYFGVHPEELWTPGVLAVKRPVAERSIDAEEALATLAATSEPPLLPDHYCEMSEQRRMLGEAIRTLPKRDRAVLEARLREETLMEIGRELGVTRERVRKLESRGRRRIRESIARRYGKLP